MNDRAGNIVVVVLALLLTATCAVNRIASEWLALGLIVIAGIPHGSFDLRFAEKRWGRSAPTRAAVIACYLASGALMSAMCLIWPTLGLAVFLLISVIHFAEGERLHVRSSTYALVLGVAAIFLPIALHISEALPYLSFFIPEVHIATVSPTISSLGYFVTLLVIALIARDSATRRSGATLQLAVCLASWFFLPPLSGFCVWFIGRHSRQHMQRSLPFLREGLHRLPRDFIVISVLAIALIAPLSLWFDLRNLHQLFAASIVLIAGLTLPHMVITHAVEKG